MSKQYSYNKQLMLEPIVSLRITDVLKAVYNLMLEGVDPREDFNRYFGEISKHVYIYPQVMESGYYIVVSRDAVRNKYAVELVKATLSFNDIKNFREISLYDILSNNVELEDVLEQLTSQTFASLNYNLKTIKVIDEADNIRDALRKAFSYFLLLPN